MADDRVTVLVPVLQEAAALPRLVAALERLDPQPAEVLCVDGGSTDETVAIARAAGWRVLSCGKGRARQINHGVAEARGALVIVLHADTIPPARHGGGGARHAGRSAHRAGRLHPA